MSKIRSPYSNKSEFLVDFDDEDLSVSIFFFLSRRQFKTLQTQEKEPKKIKHEDKLSQI